MRIAHMAQLLKTEIVEVTGCTEPASVAFAFLTARRQLKKPFDPLTVTARLAASHEVLRNASTAVVPFLKRRGLRTVVAAGLSSTAAEFNLFPSLLRPVFNKLLGLRSWLEVASLPRKGVYIRAVLSTPDEQVEVVVQGRHNEVMRIVLNGRVLFRHEPFKAPALSLPVIWQAVRKRSPMLEGLARDFVVRQVRGRASQPLPDRVAALIRARMCGSSSPVMTLTGSGNQGIFIGVPFYDLYRKRGEAILPSVLLSLLVQIFLSEKRKRISGDCGLATKAAPALAAGLAHAQGLDEQAIRGVLERVSNRLCQMKCPGALPSCGPKARRALQVVLETVRRAGEG